jgi:hypothetical protein
MDDLFDPLEGVSVLIVGVDERIDCSRSCSGEVKLAPANVLAEKMENKISTWFARTRGSV